MANPYPDNFLQVQSVRCLCTVPTLACDNFVAKRGFIFTLVKITGWLQVDIMMMIVDDRDRFMMLMVMMFMMVDLTRRETAFRHASVPRAGGWGLSRHIGSEVWSIETGLRGVLGGGAVRPAVKGDGEREVVFWPNCKTHHSADILTTWLLCVNLSRRISSFGSPRRFLGGPPPKGPPVRALALIGGPSQVALLKQPTFGSKTCSNRTSLTSGVDAQ